jgi:hypothetical protein
MTPALEFYIELHDALRADELVILRVRDEEEQDPVYLYETEASSLGQSYLRIPTKSKLLPIEEVSGGSGFFAVVDVDGVLFYGRVAVLHYDKLEFCYNETAQEEPD